MASGKYVHMCVLTVLLDKVQTLNMDYERECVMNRSQVGIYSGGTNQRTCVNGY